MTSLPVKPPRQLTSYIRERIEQGSDAFAKQYDASGPLGHELDRLFVSSDPLQEDHKYRPLRGLVHKYPNRVLFKVSLRCAAYCQFCTRAREIGDPNADMTSLDIEEAVAYVRARPAVDDVILSGGDPFFTPLHTISILQTLSTVPTVKVIRLGTRLPVQSPSSFASKSLIQLIDLLARLGEERAVFVQIQINHPDELTDAVRNVFRQLKRAGANLLAQTVFIRDLNDDVDVLHRLFSDLYHCGVIPYYIYRCDYVAGLEKFVCDLSQERRIMTELTRRLSGVAVPTYVVDVPGRGKIPVPLEFWDLADVSQCSDFDGKHTLL